MAEFRVGRLMLRLAEHAEMVDVPDAAQMREVEDELRAAVADPLALRSLTRFVGATVVYGSEHLVEVVLDRILGGFVVVERQRNETIDPDAGMQPFTLARLAPDEPADDQTHAVAIILVGEDDEPIAGVRYRVVLPNGRVAEGRTGEAGTAVLWGLHEPGECKVSFPDLDADAWEPVSSSPL